jgi:hypothetical protein
MTVNRAAHEVSGCGTSAYFVRGSDQPRYSGKSQDRRGIDALQKSQREKRRRRRTPNSNRKQLLFVRGSDYPATLRGCVCSINSAPSMIW